MANLPHMRRRSLDRTQRATWSRRLAPAAVVLGLAAVLSGCNLSGMTPTFGATPGVTSQAHDTYKLWYGMAIAGVAVAVFVWLLIGWSVVRYRRRRGDETIPKQFQAHIPLEVTYTVIPIIMVLVIFGFTVVTENAVDANPSRPAAVVDVTAYQWGWIFQYAHTGGVTIQTAEHAAPSLLPKDYFNPIYPTLTLPVGETTRIYLRSDDVVHGFYVHDFNFSRFAQPGVTNTISFTPTKTGWFTAQCTEYCGLYHSEMLFNVHIVSVSYYKAWITAEERNVKRNGLPGLRTQPTKATPQ